MKLWQDSNETVEVRWVRADPKAKLFPARHHFGSLTWTESKKPDYQQTNDGVGEQTADGRKYDRGVNLTGLTGQSYCGALPAWESGGVHGTDPPLALDASGRPLCCPAIWQGTGGAVEGGTRGPQSAVLFGKGGESQGGAGIAVPGTVLLARGGQGQGGVARLGGGLKFSARGGEGQGGAARIWSFPWAARGGQGETGAARFIPSLWQSRGGEQQGGAARLQGFPLASQGGESQGGAARFLPSVFRSHGGEGQGGAAAIAGHYFATGGGEGQGGVAWQSASFPQVSRGGVGQSGASVVPVRYTQQSAGGLSQSGSSVQPAARLQTSTGGQKEGGTSTVAAAAPQTSTGGQKEGGSSTAGSKALQTSTGGQGEGGTTTFTEDEMVTGTVLSWAGMAGAPAGYLLCDGTAYSRTTYAALFSAIGTTYGAGDGSTTFNVPDLTGRFPTAPGGPGGVGAIGTKGGNPTVALVIANLPAHGHNIPGVTRTTSATGNANNFERGEPGQGSADLTSTAVGTSTPFNTMPPYLSMRFIIKT